MRKKLYSILGLWTTMKTILKMTKLHFQRSKANVYVFLNKNQEMAKYLAIIILNTDFDLILLL